jgi:hypothetical protein
MRRLVSVVLVLGVCLALSGCGSVVDTIGNHLQLIELFNRMEQAYTTGDAVRLGSCYALEFYVGSGDTQLTRDDLVGLFTTVFGEWATYDSYHVYDLDFEFNGSTECFVTGTVSYYGTRLDFGTDPPTVEPMDELESYRWTVHKFGNEWLIVRQERLDV